MLTEAATPDIAQTSPENVAKLFQVMQMVMEMKHVFLEEENRLRTEQERELERLENVVDSIEGGGDLLTGMFSFSSFHKKPLLNVGFVVWMQRCD